MGGCRKCLLTREQIVKLYRRTLDRPAQNLFQVTPDRSAQNKVSPKPPRQKRGRPRGANGNEAEGKRHALYFDWKREKTLNPSLTKEQFAKKRLKLTDEDLEGEYSSIHRPKVDALLQALKPARMKRLHEGMHRAIDMACSLIPYAERVRRQWREAKQRSPGLTEEEFLQQPDKKRTPLENQLHEVLHAFSSELQKHGETLLADTNSDRG